MTMIVVSHEMRFVRFLNPKSERTKQFLKVANLWTSSDDYVI